MASADIPFLFQKTGDPNFGGVGNLIFFCMIDIYKMAVIFQFFHNGQHRYSISVDTQKTRDPLVQFSKFPLVQFSPSSILGSISTFMLRYA